MSILQSGSSPGPGWGLTAAEESGAIDFLSASVQVFVRDVGVRAPGALSGFGSWTQLLISSVLLGTGELQVLFLSEGII